MEVIVNRIEGEYIVLELSNKDIIDIPKRLIPGAKEGDVITIAIDKEKTNIRKKEMQELVDSVFED